MRALLTRIGVGVACLVALSAAIVASDVDFPVTPGVNIVLAVSNAGPAQGARPGDDGWRTRSSSATRS